jgi:hypothetical protein
MTTTLYVPSMVELADCSVDPDLSGDGLHCTIPTLLGHFVCIQGSGDVAQ